MAVHVDIVAARWPTNKSMYGHGENYFSDHYEAVAGPRTGRRPFDAAWDSFVFTQLNESHTTSERSDWIEKRVVNASNVSSDLYSLVVRLRRMDVNPRSERGHGQSPEFSDDDRYHPS